MLTIRTKKSYSLSFCGGKDKMQMSGNVMTTSLGSWRKFIVSEKDGTNIEEREGRRQ